MQQAPHATAGAALANATIWKEDNEEKLSFKMHFLYILADLVSNLYKLIIYIFKN